MKKLYILKIYSRDIEMSTNLKEFLNKTNHKIADKVFIANDYHGIPTYFSSLQKAMKAVTDFKFKKEDNFLYAVIEDTKMDTTDAGTWVVVDKKGKELFSYKEGRRFLGVKKSKYKKGDFVEFVDGKDILTGLVCEVPMNSKEVKKNNLKLDDYDNCYLIIFDKPTSRDPEPHSHPLEYQIINKLTKEQAIEKIGNSAVESLVKRLG